MPRSQTVTFAFQPGTRLYPEPILIYLLHILRITLVHSRYQNKSDVLEVGARF